MDYIKRAQEVVDIEIAGLQNVSSALGSGFEDAVKLILDRLIDGGKIVVTGVGKNHHIGQKISATLASTGSTSVVLHPSQAMHGDLGIMREGDVLLALSYSGETDELVAILPAVKQASVSIVAITADPESALAELSDIVIPAAVEREACPFNMAPTASTTAALVIGDALAMVLLEARGFELEDYAKLHPGGAIGRTLLLKASDIINDRLATAKCGSKVKDVIVAMTKAKSGSAAIVDAGNIVQGIFTDGDLRRNIAKHSDILEMTVDDVMTPSPVTVQADELAVEVLKIFEEHSFDDLLVVDESNKLVGVIDVQDLPKLKIL